MKSLALFLCALLTLSTPDAARAQEAARSAPAPLAAERDARAWREFASAEGRFAVLFPGEPAVATEGVPMPDGGQIRVRTHFVRTTAEYGVIYADYPFEVRGAEMQRGLLDEGARGAMASVGSELLEQKEVTLGPNPGRALKERMRGGKVMHVRMYLVGSRLYQVAVTLPRLGPDDRAASAFADEVAAKFLGSFRLLDPAGETQEGEVDALLKELRAAGEAVYGVRERPGGDSGGPPTRDTAGVGLNERSVYKPQPPYPPVAAAARAEGTVVVYVVVDEGGRVVAAQAKSGHPLLRGAAVKAAREARFEPTLVGGKPVKVAGVVTYNFILR